MIMAYLADIVEQGEIVRTRCSAAMGAGLSAGGEPTSRNPDSDDPHVAPLCHYERMSTPVNPPAGWYDDGSGRQRWWDGQQWGQFADEMPTQAIAAEPVPTAAYAAPTYAAPNAYAAPAGFAGPAGPMVGTAATKPKGLALAALIVGIVGFLTGLLPIVGAVIGVAAVVLAIFALVNKQSKGMSITGLILGAVAIISSLAMAAGFASFTANYSADPMPLPAISEPADTAEPAEEPSEEPEEPVASEEPETPDVPVEYASALEKADTYVNYMYMSKAGLYDQLTSEYGEQFSEEAAQYALDNVDADWKANALEKAKSYQETMSMSPEAIRDQLVSEFGEQFTQEEADYAIANLPK